MRNHWCIIGLALCVGLIAASAYSASISLGTVTARPNGTALVPVNESAFERGIAACREAMG